MQEPIPSCLSVCQGRRREGCARLQSERIVRDSPTDFSNPFYVLNVRKHRRHFVNTLVANKLTSDLKKRKICTVRRRVSVKVRRKIRVCDSILAFSTSFSKQFCSIPSFSRIRQSAFPYMIVSVYITNVSGFAIATGFLMPRKRRAIRILIKISGWNVRFKTVIKQNRRYS